MPAGSLIGAMGLLALAWAPGAASYFAAWITIGIAMAASLYDPAFATLGRIFGDAARAPITVLTLAGGFASTVSWPATQFLIETVGWRGAYLVYAALLAGVAAPLHAFALPRQQASGVPHHRAASDKKTDVIIPSHGLAFVLVAAGFAAYAFVPSALSAQLLAIFHRFGLPATTVVVIGSCLVRRRSWLGLANCRLRGGCIRYGLRAWRSVCWSPASCCWRCCRFRRWSPRSSR
jgi:hypothetical protein